jgi:hypothetical protein
LFTSVFETSLNAVFAIQTVFEGSKCPVCVADDDFGDSLNILSNAATDEAPNAIIAIAHQPIKPITGNI